MDAKVKRPYTFQASYDCHALWKLAEGVELPKPLEDATEMWIKWNSLYVLWEGNLPMEFELTEVGDVEVDSKRPADLMVWLGEDYNGDNIVYDDTLEDNPNKHGYIGENNV